MDNLEQLSSLLSPILNDPDAMAGIAQAASQLGLGDFLSGSEPQDANEDKSRQERGEGEKSGDISDMLGRVLPMLGSADAQDDSMKLLSALRPFLHGDRARRLDDAQRLVKLISVMNTMRRQGLL